MATAKKPLVNRRRPRTGFNEDAVRLRGAPRARSRAGRAAVKGSRVGDDLVVAFEEMAAHLRGEIELQAHDVPADTMTPARIKAILAKVASSTRA